MVFLSLSNVVYGFSMWISLYHVRELVLPYRHLPRIYPAKPTRGITHTVTSQSMPSLCTVLLLRPKYLLETIGL